MIENFAKIERADIQIDGITVIAGENDTGKSTVGKVLFCLFNALSDIEEKVDRQREAEIRGACTAVLKARLGSSPSGLRTVVPARQIASFAAGQLRQGEALEEEQLRAVCAQEAARYTQEEGAAEELTGELVQTVLKYAGLPLDQIYRTVVTNQFSEVFAGQIHPLYPAQGPTRLTLTIRGKDLTVGLEGDQCVELDAQMQLVNHAFYLDDPFILDELNDQYALYFSPFDAAPKAQLLQLLQEKPKAQLLEGILAKEKLATVLRALDRVVHGEVVRRPDHGLFLEQAGLDEPVSLNNLSTGLKAFVLLKMLLEGGILKERDVLIVDEPEIHLHPQWQIAYAQLLVLLEKEFGLSMVVTTHSPYFLDALNLFSVKHGLTEKMNYYLSHAEDGKARLENVNGDLQRIYEKMASPIDMLEQLREQLRQGEGGGDD